ncbi:MAG: conjugal transfer protein TraF [candidate division Zixibacteria bacterium]|nr:conjugal transfer protein TraF [candidate division Zixibacteria bacterium]
MKSIGEIETMAIETMISIIGKIQLAIINAGRKIKMKKLIVLTILVIMGLTSFVSAGNTYSPFRHDMYALGMGDAFVAYGNTSMGFIYNPAFLAKSNSFQLTLLDLQVTVNNKFSDVVSYMNDNADDFEDWDSLSSAEKNELLDGIKKFDDRWVAVGANPSVSVLLPMGIGFAVYDNLAMKVKLDRGIYEPRGYAEIRQDLVFVGGYAREINPKLSVGGNFKFISRRETGAIKLNASEFGEGQDIYDDAEDDLQNAKSGFGLDVGALYQLQPNIELGASIIDLIGTVDGNKTPINLRAGVAYHYTPNFVSSKFLKGIVLAGDIEDMFNRDGDQLFNKIHLGADFQMPVINFRFGFNQGYPGLGVGLNTKFFKVDYAFVGQELGGAPGRDSEYSHYARISLGWM